MNDRVRCIVNADDFGISAEVNDAISKMALSGKVTSASIIANGPRFDDALRRAKDLPASVGLHLNITQFAPLSRDARLRPLLNANGEFTGLPKIGAVLSEAVRKAIVNEWQHQYERVCAAIGGVSHVDSHHHVHTNPLLLGQLLRFIKSNNISCVRISRNLYASRSVTTEAKIIGLKRAWNWRLRLACGPAICDYFGDLSGLISNKNRIPPGSAVELMAHPGHRAYVSETIALNEDWRERIPYHIDLISYKEMRSRKH